MNCYVNDINMLLEKYRAVLYGPHRELGGTDLLQHSVIICKTVHNCFLCEWKCAVISHKKERHTHIETDVADRMQIHETASRCIARISAVPPRMHVNSYRSLRLLRV